ncbi:hypothetical protein PNP03_09105 [Halobacterium salinarum]|nr:HalOD1 output domain-containing protein [Halobacterium salinarum]MDL0122854.1 hypothetical protein [Halobacterium salinarum]
MDRSPDFLVEIVETLEVHELPSDPHQLHDVVDIEALEQLIASSVGDIEVRFTVEGIQVVVIGDSVDVRFDKPADSPNQ